MLLDRDLDLGDLIRWYVITLLQIPFLLSILEYPGHDFLRPQNQYLVFREA
jgi:hypothetical protein